jgi:LysM repeat protein
MVNIRMNFYWHEICVSRPVAWKGGVWSGTILGILLLGIAGCSPLEPIAEPEVSDLQLTVDTLKGSLRDAQRTMTELRAEVDARRQELADVQIARAQLEGHVREAERRLTEARHVIDLQREELSGSRSDRARMGRTGAALQNQLKQLQKQVSKMGESVKGDVSPTATVSPQDGPPQLANINLEQEPLTTHGEERIGIAPSPEPHMSSVSSVEEMPVVPRLSTANTRLRVSIKPGDTLWRIGRRYHISVERLMAMNALPNDQIRVGQILWLSEFSTGEPEHERM